jgi:hypothetical protein
LSYLRFSPREYRALCRICRPLSLDGMQLPPLKRFLIESLLVVRPALAKRVALFGRSQLRLLLDHFREQEAKQEPELSAEDFYLLMEACHAWASGHRFLRYYRISLIRLFNKVKPSLANKLARMSEDQFQALYGRVTERRKR